MARFIYDRIARVTSEYYKRLLVTARSRRLHYTFNGKIYELFRAYVRITSVEDLYTFQCGERIQSLCIYHCEELILRNVAKVI